MKKTSILAGLLLSILTHFSLAQEWKEIYIDGNVSLSIPQGFKKEEMEGDIIRITTKLKSGTLTIERHTVSEVTISQSDTTGLKAYTHGYLTGIRFRGQIDIIENEALAIKGAIARKVQYETREKKLNWLYFFVTDQYIYMIRLEDDFDEAERILSSIQIRK